LRGRVVAVVVQVGMQNRRVMRVVGEATAAIQFEATGDIDGIVDHNRRLGLR
jgi:hypothetical protein